MNAYVTYDNLFSNRQYLCCRPVLFFIKQPTLLTLFFSYVCCGTYSSMECFSVASTSNRLYKYMFFYSLQSSFLLFNLVSLSWYAEIMVLAFRSVGVPFLRKQILYFYIISSYRMLFRLLSVFSFVRKIDIRTSYMYTSRHKCILKFPNLCYSTLLSFWIWWQWRCSFHGLQKSLPVYNVYKISCIQIGGSGEVDRKVQFLFSFVMVHSLNIYIFVPSNQISVGTCIIFVPSSAPMRTHWSCLITEVNLSPIDPLLV